MLTVYVRDALAAKGGCNEHHKLASFSALLASLSQEDFSGVVQPVLQKLQKKNPDSVLAAVASFVENVSIDLSAHIGMFLQPVLRQLRSPKEHVRRLAVELTGNLAGRCGSPEVCATRSTCSCFECCIILVTLLDLKQDHNSSRKCKTNAAITGHINYDTIARAAGVGDLFEVHRTW